MLTSSGRELEVRAGKEMEELGFSSTRFFTVSMFSSIILVRGRPEILEEETSTEAINLLITLERRHCEEADVVTIGSA